MYADIHFEMKPVQKILLVDDKEENLYSLESMLAEDGREILKATSGQEALRIALDEEIALILLDVQMPGMDGYEVADLLKSAKRTQKISIVFVTAISKERQYMLKGLNAGAIDYLFKPLDTDVTRSKVETLLRMHQQQVEIEQMNARLRQLDAEKNFFLGMAAHDLRNPIGNIQTLAQLLREEAEPRLKDEERTYLAMITQASRSMVDLLNNILDITKIESGQASALCEDLGLSGLLQECISHHKVAADAKEIHLSYSTRREHIRIRANRTQFLQILNNLVSNAIKYSHRKTAVEITAEHSLTGEITIKVIDQGQGIPAHEHNKLFKPFTRTSVTTTSGESSNGLGLCIVKRLVEGHGGRIWVESQPGKGSTFAFTVDGVRAPAEPELKTA